MSRVPLFLRPGAAVALLVLGQALGAPDADGQRIIRLPSDHRGEVITYQATPDFDLDAIRNFIHARVNRARRAAGFEDLALDEQLNLLAHDHSRDMAESGFFGHVNLRGETASVRARRMGSVCVSDPHNPVRRGVGENLYTGFAYLSYRLVYGPNRTVAEFDWSTGEEIARLVVDGWLASPGHRANLLHAGYGSHGIGIVLTDALELFVTQNFC